MRAALHRKQKTYARARKDKGGRHWSHRYSRITKKGRVQFEPSAKKKLGDGNSSKQIKSEKVPELVIQVLRHEARLYLI